ncbi:large ribosomal subunit protein uL3m-like [Babylonia areolata]|uniref:large ribosomal subunit protein uL3m-like n=1 Tax=Babylonia areolata TaxID=304850 RepID=UPI003FD0BE81
MAALPAMTLRQAVCQLRCRLSGIQLHQSGPIGVLSNYCQVRSKKHNVAQYNLQPEWYTRKKPPQTDEDLTRENERFVKEVIRSTYRNTSPVLKDDVGMENQEYRKGTRRCGVIAVKIGVIPQWTKEGKRIMVTLLQVLDNHVIRYTPPEEFEKTSSWQPWWGKKFGSMVVGSMSTDPRMFSKAYVNLFTEAGVPPKKVLTRFLVTPDAAIQPGTPLSVMHYRVGDYVDVQAKTIDHGFQGVVKRWGMKGMPASHGVTKAHRKMGSTGGGGDKSAIWKGKKMPGHMGDRWTKLKGLKIWRINTRYNVLYVQGPNIPGNTHGIVRVYDTILPTCRPSAEDHPPFPTWTGEASSQDLPLEFFDDNLHRMSDPSLTFE